MLKKPMTTEEYFNKICGILKEKGMMPDILDYGLATHDPVPMKTYEFNIRKLDYVRSLFVSINFLHISNSSALPLILLPAYFVSFEKSEYK